MLKEFMVREDLYESIPDVMQCLVTAFFVGRNESYVESIGSKLRHHNPPNRNLDLDNLAEELTIAWNGPQIQHWDEIVTETIDNMHGASKWHFHRRSHHGALKFYIVSKSVDAIQQKRSTFFI